MATSGAALICGSNGTNKASFIKTVGVEAGRTGPNGRELSAEEQQYIISAKEIQRMNKGTLVSINVTNNGGAGAQSFTLFDVAGIASASGAPANGAQIVITSTFAGLNSAAGYTTLKELTKGTRSASVGTMFEFSSATEINRSNIKIWNGNYEEYNFKTLGNYLQLAKDTYANDQKVLVMNTTFYMNGFFAISGTVSPDESINILFNLTLFSNF